MADRVEPAVVSLGDDRDDVTIGERPDKIALGAVHRTDDRSFRQTRPDRCGKIADGCPFVELTLGTIGKGDRDLRRHGTEVT